MSNGVNRPEPSRYIITGRCIACGTCLAVCRQGCIAGGAPPFVIRQGYCIRCGVCAEKCPVRAIVREEAAP